MLLVLPVRVGVARIFSWGKGQTTNLMQCAMTSLEIFETGTFCGTKYNGRSEAFAWFGT